MRNLLFYRIALGTALAGLLLPWLAVSLGGEDLATMSGIDALLGRAATPFSQSVQLGPQPALILSALAATAALAGSFWVKSEKVLAALLAGLPALAIVAVFLGVVALKEVPRRETARSANTGFEQVLQAALSRRLSLEERPGYFLTLLGLATAVGIASTGVRARPPGIETADKDTSGPT
ncbi:MAG: hypothetical protein ABL883_11875 [Terricaulis sp.]